MTKKNFIALADALRATKPDNLSELAQWSLDVSAIADCLQRQNPAFKRERWLDYIHGERGPNGGKL
jgi:hypothetical protein